MIYIVRLSCNYREFNILKYSLLAARPWFKMYSSTLGLFVMLASLLYVFVTRCS